MECSVFLSLNIKNIEEGPIEDINNFSKKVSQRQKKLKGGPFGIFQRPFCRKISEKWDPLVSPGIVCYAEKKEKLFWFSSLGQMLQFETIKFRRT